MTRSFKGILVGLLPQEEKSAERSAAASYAVDLAARLGAELTFQSLVPRAAWVPYSIWSSFPAELAASEKQRLRELAESSADAACRLARDKNVKCSVDIPELALTELTSHFNDKARLHDLIVLGAGYGTLTDHRHIFEEALFDSGRPVIVVPEGGGDAKASNVVVAWDGSARAARAAGDALPLLKDAEKVSVVTVTGEKDITGITPSDLAGYLARHGITASTYELNAISGNAGATLQRYAEDNGADLLVMGAFVHSRIRQAVLGGVTRSLLDEARIPLFMAY